MIDYVAAVEAESARFAAAIAATPMDAPVPSCPGWTVADLTYHLTEVQQFWAAIVDDLLPDPESVVKVERPADDGQLPGMFNRESGRLVDALARRDPGDVCWSWHDAGHSVGWVRRRQAHEALIHRVDAELAAGLRSEVSELLAADGIDEILSVMLDATDLQDWARYEPDGNTATIEAGDRSWSMDFGRFKGTSPASGTTYDLPALRLGPPAAAPGAVLRGAASDLDLWLWGRGPLDPITVVGDGAIADQLRATAADGTV